MNDAAQIATKDEQPVPEALSLDGGPEGEEGPEEIAGDIDPQEAIDRFGLATAEQEAARDAAPERIDEEAILDALQRRLYEAVPSMEADKALRLYEAMVKRQETKARLAMKRVPTADKRELREKAARAFGGSAASFDEE